MAEEQPARPVLGINDLPLDILRSVLSLLSARDVVRTCVQSQLWRDLWKSVPVINATILDFDVGGRSFQQSEVLFKRFMNHFLEARGPVPLQDFRLWYSVSEDDAEAQAADANAWISYALQQDASHILVFNRFLPLHLAPAVFTSKYLKCLELGGAVLVQGFFRQLNNDCPELKALFLLACQILDINIYSQTIEVLALTFTGPDEFGWRHGDQPDIWGLSVVSLTLHAPHGPRTPLLLHMESLEEAWIIISRHLQAIDAPDIRQFPNSLTHVRRLEFDYDRRLLTMGNNYQWCPTFSNLTDLILHEWCVHEDFYALIVFLQKSPNLKRLTLILKPLREQPGDEPSIVGELEERSFTCTQLQGVEIVCSNQCSLLPKVQRFLLDGGITPDKIHVKQHR